MKEDGARSCMLISTLQFVNKQNKSNRINNLYIVDVSVQCSSVEIAVLYDT